MKDRLRRAGFWTLMSTLVLTLAGSLTPRIEASPMTTEVLYYNTSGTVGNSTGPIDFTGVGHTGPSPTYDSFIAPGAFSLGSFHVGALPSTVSVTYDNTPFQILANFTTSPGAGPVGTVEIDGALNGTIKGNSASSLFASVTSIATPVGDVSPPFLTSALSVILPQALAPHGTDDGKTPLMAQITTTLIPEPQLVPEPGSFAVFAVALGGLGLWRWRRGAVQRV